MIQLLVPRGDEERKRARERGGRKERIRVREIDR